MIVKRNILLALALFSLILLASYPLATAQSSDTQPTQTQNAAKQPKPGGDDPTGILQSQNLKTDVIIALVGIASLIGGFGLRDVIARIKQRRRTTAQGLANQQG